MESADLLVVAGSSLQVYPAAALPLHALDRGARLVIVNDEETPFDDVADLVVQGPRRRGARPGRRRRACLIQPQGSVGRAARGF